MEVLTKFALCPDMSKYQAKEYTTAKIISAIR
jgi:hypothetical protein